MEVAAQRPANGLDRPTSLKLARALRSSCDDHHKRALFTADGALADEAAFMSASWLRSKSSTKRRMADDRLPCRRAESIAASPAARAPRAAKPPRATYASENETSVLNV